MTARARRSIATLAILACVTLVTGAAFVAATYAEWNWLSLGLGCVVAVLLVVCIDLLIDALERWLDRADGSAEHPENQP